MVTIVQINLKVVRFDCETVGLNGKTGVKGGMRGVGGEEVWSTGLGRGWGR